MAAFEDPEVCRKAFWENGANRHSNLTHHAHPKMTHPRCSCSRAQVGGAGMQLCKTGVFGNKAAQNALLVKIIFGSKVGIAFIYCQKNTRTKKGSQKGKKGDPKMRGGAIPKKKEKGSGLINQDNPWWWIKIGVTR